MQDERKSRQRDERLQVTTFSELRAQRRCMCLLDRGYPPTGGCFGFSCRKGVGKPIAAAAAAAAAAEHGSAPTPRSNLVHE